MATESIDIIQHLLEVEKPAAEQTVIEAPAEAAAATE